MTNDSMALTIQSLIEQKQGLVQYAGQSVEDLRATQHGWYLQAQAAGAITTISLLIQKYGVAEGDKVVWARSFGDKSIRAIRVTATGAIEVSVNGHVVCSDLVAGDEFLIMGQWGVLMARFYQQQEAESEWKARLDANAVKEKLIQELTADI
jgi:hypothetical protein